VDAFAARPRGRFGLGEGAEHSDMLFNDHGAYLAAGFDRLLAQLHP